MGEICDRKRYAARWTDFYGSLIARQDARADETLDELTVRRMERIRRRGYQRHPVRKGEFDLS